MTTRAQRAETGTVGPFPPGFAELRDAARAAHDAADFRTLKRLSSEMSALGESSGDAGVAAWGNFFAGIEAIYRHDGDAATRALGKALVYFRSVGDPLAEARTLMNLASVAVDIDVDPTKARRLYEQAAPAIEASGDFTRLATLRGNLGEVCRLEGDYAGALRNARTSLRLFTQAGDSARAAWQLVNMAHYHLLNRDTPAAVENMMAAYVELSKTLNPLSLASYFDVWILIGAKNNRWEDVARLLGFIERLRSEQNVPRLSGILPWLSLPLERLAGELSDDRSHELFAQGAGFSIERAQALASEIGEAVLA